MMKISLSVKRTNDNIQHMREGKGDKAHEAAWDNERE